VHWCTGCAAIFLQFGSDQRKIWMWAKTKVPWFIKGTFSLSSLQGNTPSLTPSTKQPILYSSDHALLLCITLHAFVGRLCGCWPCKEFSLALSSRLPTFPFNHRSPKRMLSGGIHISLAQATSGTSRPADGIVAALTTRANWGALGKIVIVHV
jgi:hypothetical protein